jgi:hypothetical protein
MGKRNSMAGKKPVRAIEEFSAAMRKLGNACPNDTDGDGDCWMCARYPNAHWVQAVNTVLKT